MDGSSNISNSEEAFVGTGNLRSGDQAARDLQKRILDLEEENAILKKVMHIFAKDRR
jgi:transposase